MKLFYQIGANSYAMAVRIASIWNPKAKQWVRGRKESPEKLKKFKSDKPVHWFHCASLGEFEQARPLIEKLKANKDLAIAISFFSPSGYDIRKNYELSDLVFYLPEDSLANAKFLFNELNPVAVYFIKYEFWGNYIEEAHLRKVPIYSIAAVFRPDQIFFKWYGGYMRKLLHQFTKIFVQNEDSATLLASYNIKAIVSGDTRYDRVLANARKVKSFPEIENFIQAKKVLICGSVWEQDLATIAPVLNQLSDDWKIIVAPHEISKETIDNVSQKIGNSVLYSTINTNNELLPKVLIIDNIGMLMHLYQYGNLAYIGGAFKTGLHNILEPAAFGLPVIFGPHHQKFHEAKLFIDQRVGFEISDSDSFQKCFEHLSDNSEIRDRVKLFMESNTGATEIIFSNLAGI